MDVTAGALRRIRDLMRLNGVSASAAVRVSVRAGGVRLDWETAPARPGDMILMKRGIPVRIESRAFVQLADYRLDVERLNGSPRFLLRHKQILEGTDRRRNS